MYTLCRLAALSGIIALSGLLSACNGSGIDDPTKDTPPMNNQPPVISLSRFEAVKADDKLQIFQGQAISISVDVSDPDDNLDFVEVVVDGKRLGEAIMQAPFQWPASIFDGFQVGAYKVKIVAWDKAGLSASVERTITIRGNETPSIFFNSPKNDTVVDFGGSVDVSVDVSDLDGTVDSVELFLDGNSVGKKSSSPFSWEAASTPELDNLQTSGTRIISVTAIDNEGGESTKSVSITVNEEDKGQAAEGKRLWIIKCAECHGQVVRADLKRLLIYRFKKIIPTKVKSFHYSV